MMAPILAFADYTKLFLLETDVSKDGIGGSAITEADKWDDTTLLPMAVGPLCISWEELPLN